MLQISPADAPPGSACEQRSRCAGAGVRRPSRPWPLLPRQAGVAEQRLPPRPTASICWGALEW